MAGFLTTSVLGRAQASDAAPGEVPPWLHPHARVRLTPFAPSRARPILGEFREARGDSVWIRTGFGPHDTGIPLSQISRFEVSRERSPRTWHGAGIGFLGGALIGGAAGVSEGAEQGDTGARVAVDGLLLGCLLMIPCALIGHAEKTDHWVVIWSREADQP